MTTKLDQMSMADLADVVRTIAANADPRHAYQTIDATLKTYVGYKLLTVLVCIVAERSVERTYSSNEALYPIGGRKKNLDSPWGRTVVDRAQPLISRDDADIQHYFADFETLRGLGISGMINVPVVADGAVIGSLNISGEAGQFTEADIPALTVLAGLLAPALMRYQ